MLDIIEANRLAVLYCNKLDRKENLTRQELAVLPELVDNTDLDLHDREKLARVLYAITSARLVQVQKLENSFRAKLLAIQHELETTRAANNMAQELLSLPETSLKQILQQLIDAGTK